MKRNMDVIKGKIKKLLSLSKSPNEHEAALALHKAQELLRKHNLSMEEVFSFTADNVRENSAFSGKKVPTWIGWLASVVAETFGVRVYKNSQYLDGRPQKREIRFIGFEADLMIAEHCFEYVRRGIESGYRGKRAELRSRGIKKFPRNFKNAYALGYIEAVKEKMAQLARIQPRQDFQANEHVSSLPVVKQNAIDEYIKQHLNLGRARRSRMQLDRAAYMAGLEDGARIPISKPVTGTGPVAIA